MQASLAGVEEPRHPLRRLRRWQLQDIVKNFKLNCSEHAPATTMVRVIFESGVKWEDYLYPKMGIVPVENMGLPDGNTARRAAMVDPEAGGGLNELQTPESNHTTVPYEDMTLAALKRIAKAAKVSGHSTMKKGALISALRSSDDAT